MADMQGDPWKYDISFMYSKHCDLACTFCMYASSPDVHDALDLSQLKWWLKTLRYHRVNSFGFYGGEPWLFMREYDWIIQMLPQAYNGPDYRLIPAIPLFVITNGTWSKNPVTTLEFLDWAGNHNMKVFVSGTDQHVRFQDRKVLEMVARAHPDWIVLKKPDTTILPMGNLLGKPVSCTVRCQEKKRPARIAIQPDGTIIFQSCDGVYPVVGTIKEDFNNVDGRIQRMIYDEGFSRVCPYYKEAHETKRASRGL